jgi:hypothetical protein
MPERTTTVGADEFHSLGNATAAVEMATIATDSWAAREATQRSVLELLAEAGDHAKRALGADWPFLDERRVA